MAHSTCIITSTNRSGSCDASTVMVHCRNARVLSCSLGLDLIEGEDDANLLRERKYDNIICNYASHYMPWRSYFDAVMNDQKDARLWWMVNDHDVEDNQLLRAVLKATGCKRTYGVISNNTRTGFRQWILRKWIVKNEIRLDDCIDEWRTVNLNALTFEDHSLRPPDESLWFREEYPAIYWGSWRKWRLPYFKKYSHRQIFFSTSKKNQSKLIANGCRFRFIDPMRWGPFGTLSTAKATVYIEDPHTHKNYAFAANRFYESLSYGVKIAFDESCRSTIDTLKGRFSGIVTINSPDELLYLAEHGENNPPEWIMEAKLEQREVIEEIRKLLQLA